MCYTTTLANLLMYHLTYNKTKLYLKQFVCPSYCAENETGYLRVEKMWFHFTTKRAFNVSNPFEMEFSPRFLEVTLMYDIAITRPEKLFWFSV